MNTEQISLLVQKAIKAREQSYSPYSSFSVGAALLCADGSVYTGANIENAAYSPTVCAERVAFFRAVHDGHREFSAIAIVGGKSGQEIDAFCAPCGVCRQVISEFCGSDFLIVLSNGKKVRTYTLGELLPCRFDLAE